MQWTEKETLLFQDMMNSEKICIEKYADYAERACDTELKTIFEDIKTTEQEHYKTLEQMLGGTIPKMNAQGTKKKQDSSSKETSTAKTKKKTVATESDEYLCRDALDTEKHVSSLYDTCIFEFVSAQARDVLNHIQKEEQEHGKRIYDYMAAHGMTA